MRGILKTKNYRKILTLSVSVAVFAVTMLGTSSTFAIATHPAQLVGGGAQWKLTIPKQHKPVKGIIEYKGSAFDSYTSSQFAFLDSTRTGLIMRVWHGDSSTKGSGNPRTELRERYNNDPEGYWPLKGTHIMEIVTQVNRLTKKKPHVVIAQVHGSSDDLSVWRVEGKQLWITNGDNTHGKLVDGNFQLGRKVKLKYVITNGTFNYYYNDNKINYSLKFGGTGYFKAGNYLQSNPGTAKDESTKEYSEVVLYCTKVAHNPKAGFGGCAATTSKDSQDSKKDELSGEPLIGSMTAAKCASLDRKVIKLGTSKLCAKRKDGKTVSAAPECVDPQPGYAKLTYIVDAKGDYCGYY